MAERRNRRGARWLGDAGECGFLAQLREWPQIGGRPPLGGLEDDAAVFADGRGRFRLLTCDVLVEGTHFTRETTTPRDLGDKALTVNVSDVAALAGAPEFFTVGLGAPPETPLEWLEEFYAGLARAARRYGATLAGGDTVRAERLTLAVTLLGEFRGPRAALPLRSRVRAGDYVYVTGTLGDSAAGLELLLGGRKGAGLAARDAAALERRHCRPRARLAEARALGRGLKRWAAIDLSDDLGYSLERLVDCSGRGFRIALEALPVSPALVRFARLKGRSPERLAVSGGEDFELLFTCAEKPEVVAAILRRAGLRTRVSCIGRALKHPGIAFWRNDAPVEVSLERFQHFSP